ncbi:unnamed protein product [Leuciscus chuanchicus]
MGNFRQMLCVAGCPVLSVSTDGRGKRRLKKPRRSRTNFLPDMPDAETTSSFKEERRALLKEVKKKNPNNKFIDAAMSSVSSSPPESSSVVDIVMFSDVPKAFGLLMGLLYGVNIDYPKRMKYTFEVLQKLVMNIGGSSCSSCVHGLRNKLFRKK